MDKQIKIGSTTYVIKRKFVGKKSLKQILTKLLLKE